jgi:outer membrane biosynthesis protein TonB
MEPKHLISAAIAISVACHLALATGVYFADARPAEHHEESVAVDLVTPQELAEAEKKAEETPPEPEKKPEPEKPEFRLPDLTNKPTLEEQKTQATAAKPQSSTQNTPPQPQKTSPQQPAPSAQQQAAQQPAAQQPPPQQQAQQQVQPATPPPSPPPAAQPPLQQQAALQSQPPAPQPGPQQVPPQPEADITVKYGVMLGLPEGFGGGASEQADLSKLDIGAFRRHLKTCSKLPATVARGDDARVKLRAVFSPDGRLVAEPSVIEVRRPAKAALLMQAAKQALEACQPYAMLPADKYDEWKVLDLDFTPQDFAG